MQKRIEEMDPKELGAKFEQQIGDMESEYLKVEADYDKAREYFEHDQEPSGVPTDKEYIEENLLTDMVLRLIGGLVGGKFSPILKGGGANAESIRELFLDILDENFDIVQDRALDCCFDQGLAWTILQGEIE